MQISILKLFVLLLFYLYLFTRLFILFWTKLFKINNACLLNDKFVIPCCSHAIHTQTIIIFSHRMNKWGITNKVTTLYRCTEIYSWFTRHRTCHRKATLAQSNKILLFRHQSHGLNLHVKPADIAAQLTLHNQKVVGSNPARVSELWAWERHVIISCFTSSRCNIGSRSRVLII